MKIDNGKYKFEKRRKRFFTPIIYMFAEVILVWILLSIANVSFQIQTWETWSYIILVFAFIYSGNKTYFIFDRQREYKLA
jgi:predicted membrane-bound dolichyl-phosphate-mannose-protein mannosyltransferase